MSQHAGMVWLAAVPVVLCASACAGHDSASQDDPSASVAVASLTPIIGAEPRRVPRVHPVARGRLHGHHEPLPPSTDAGVGTPAEEGGSNDGGSSAFVRVAHMGSGFPAFDVCLGSEAAERGSLLGPLLRANRLPEGVIPAQVSGYVEVPAGAHHLRLVASGATNCDTDVAFFASGGPLPPLEPGEHYTVVGSGSSAKLFFYVFTLHDELPEQGAKVRLVSTYVPGRPLGVGTGTGDAFVPWISNVQTGSVEARPIGSPPETDENGYAVLTPVAAEQLTLRVGAGTEFLHVPDFSVREGQVLTLFAGGGLPSLGFSLVICDDFAAPEAPVASCSVVME